MVHHIDMNETITGFAYQLVYLFTHLTLADVLDIVLVTASFFLVLQAMRQTRASQMLRGIIIVVILGLAVLNLLPLNTFNWLLRSLLLAGVVALPIIFQDELRRALVRLSQIGRRREDMASAYIQLKKAIISAANQLAARHEGALIVLEGKTSLAEIIETGIPLQADVLTTELLVTLFYPKTPLHDGAVIVRGNRLVAASCILPVQTGETGEKHLGTRHRAALGLSSQIPDALVIVVSEERGSVSVAQGGRLHQDLSSEQIEKWLDRFHDQLIGQSRSRWRWLRGPNPVTALRNLLLALGLALIAWVGVIFQTDPPQQITLTNVSLNVTAPVTDLVLMNDVPETINVQVQTTHDRIADLDAESVRADLNLADLTTGVHRVPIKVALADPRAQLVSLSPDFVDVTLAPHATLTFTPTIVIPDLDSLPLGYAVGELSITPEAITVQGPLSLVKRVVEVRVELTLNSRRTGFQQTLSLVLLDESGQRLEGLHPSPEKVQVEVPIRHTFYTREIAIQAEVNSEDLNPDFKVTSARVFPATVTLIGDHKAINNAGDYLITAPISLTHITDDLTMDVPLLLPDGTQAVDALGETVSSVVAQVTVEPVTSYLVLTLKPTFMKLSPSLSLQQFSPDEINALLTGPKPLVEEVQAEPDLVAVFLDLGEYDTGAHTLTLEVQAPEGLHVELFPPQLQVTLEELEE
jgi:diadenylate cyclase